MLTSVVICERVKMDGNVTKIYGGGIYRENVKKSPFREVIDKLFTLRQIYTDEGNDLRKVLVRLLMDSLFSFRIRKDINES